jgi:hypothetical protein
MRFLADLPIRWEGILGDLRHPEVEPESAAADDGAAEAPVALHYGVRLLDPFERR